MRRRMTVSPGLKARGDATLKLRAPTGTYSSTIACFVSSRGTAPAVPAIRISVAGPPKPPPPRPGPAPRPPAPPGPAPRPPPCPPAGGGAAAAFCGSAAGAGATAVAGVRVVMNDVALLVRDVNQLAIGARIDARHRRRHVLQLHVLPRQQRRRDRQLKHSPTRKIRAHAGLQRSGPFMPSSCK